MRPISTADTPTEPTETTTGKKHSQAEQVAVPFSEVHISKWNRSFGGQPDEKYIKDLASDIKRNGLIHPITLVTSKSGESSSAILAGANRLWALRKMRGDDSGLMEGEYVARTDITEEDPRCLDISLSENRHRRQPSVIETARYVNRLLQQEHVDQKKLAPKLHLRREAVNRLSKLVQCFDQLPESWQEQLSRSPSQEDADAPAITLSHWVEVAGVLGENKVTPHVKGVLENAVNERWSTRDLRKAVRESADSPTGSHSLQSEGTSVPMETESRGADSCSAKQQAEPPTTKVVVSPRHVVGKALASVLAAADAIKDTMPAEANQLSHVAKKVERVLKQIEAAEIKTGSAKHDTTPKAA